MIFKDFCRLLLSTRFESFIINNEKISISWENEIEKGVILHVSAPSFIEALVAVEILLKKKSYQHLWHMPDVKFQAGIFEFEIVEVKEFEA